jgi:coenzyme F420-reducing hydrogenase alpha subunit
MKKTRRQNAASPSSKDKQRETSPEPSSEQPIEQPMEQPMNEAASPQASPASPKKVNVHHLTRVEGHGNIVVEIETNGKVKTCRWEVPEAPRFFEAMIQGRSFQDVHQITSRICGICSIGHQLASLQATEDALGVRVSEQTLVLRKLALHGENLQSHILHAGYLVLPDLMGVPSVIPLAGTHTKELLVVVGLHRLANEFSRCICGRTTHPQRLVPGGMGKIPTKDDLLGLKTALEDSLPALQTMAELFASLQHKLPDYHRDTEYIGLVSPAEYALYWGSVGSTMDKRRPSRFYKDFTREYCVPQSTAKWTKNVVDSYMVGALARVNLNYEHLTHRAKRVAGLFGLKPICTNPYYNTLAQVVECVHSTEDSIQLIDGLLTRGLRQEAPVPITPRAGAGHGAVEVPRGILFHNYEYDERGRIATADCVIPTNQNHANIQKDLEGLVPKLSNQSEQEIELQTSMLVRAYDPCISCSTHVIDLTKKDAQPFVRFVRV